MKDSYWVCRINSKEAKSHIHKHHYSRGSHNGPSPCYGLYDGQTLIGACMFATPCSENVRASVFGSDYRQHVTELHRLHIIDDTPKNTESWFISRVLKLLKNEKPSIWAVISFSDLTEGHEGTIYKATNAYRCGKSSPATFFLDGDGRLRHPRQCGVNITKDEAVSRGWKPVKRASKLRYIWLLPDSRRHKKQLINLSRYNEIREQKFN